MGPLITISHHQSLEHLQHSTSGTIDIKDLALAAAAFLVATSAAFAGSDHFDPQHTNQSAPAVDDTYTASIRKPDMVRHGVQATMKSDADEPGHKAPGVAEFTGRDCPLRA
ncbi:DUF680 domain-containing protein [Mesorhizobium loti]|uniref:DUF680 domain-containing protein n=1 Tax=Rhizobium loti TaxID=381 RepID=UPI0031BB05A8